MKKHERIIMTINPELAKLEAKIGDSLSNGTISGYASVFGVRDSVGDIVASGAFKRAIDNQISAGSVPLMIQHFRDGGDAMESVGVIVEAKEDDIGLWINAELDGSEASQNIRQKVRANPGIFGMSIGFLNTGEGFRVLPEGGRELQEINLKEVTITLMPANESTMGTLQAKSSLEELVIDIQKRLDALESKQVMNCAEDVQAASTEDSVACDASNAQLIAQIRRTLSILEN